MNKILILFAAALCVANTNAQELKVDDSRISDVTVFLNGAQLHREASVQLKAGENVVRLSGLTQFVDPNSIQVEGNNKYLILGVKHQVNFLKDQSISPDIKAKQDSLVDLEFRLEMRKSMRNVYSAEKDMIISNKSIKGEQNTLLADDLIEISDFFRTRLQEIEYKLLEINKEERDLQKEIKRIRNHLNSLNARLNRQTSDVYVTLQAKSAARADIKVSYLVRQAGWFPVYDIRAEDTNKPLELVYKGKVYQSTGNDWEDVKLTLSTGNPNAGGQAPELYPWKVYLQDPEAYKNKARAAYGAPQTQSYDDYGGAEMEIAYAADLTTTVQNVVTTEFNIGVPYDIPSDNQQYDVETKRVMLDANFKHFSIPKLDKDAFLLADVTDWMQHNLMPGESNIYFRGTYVGKAFIDPSITDDTLHLSMGRDKSVVVQREQIKEFCKTSTFGMKKKTTKAYEISVQNTKGIPINIRIEDQLPLSTDGELEIDVEEISGALHDTTTGKLSWDMLLQPGETNKMVIRFSAKYPKKKILTNL